MVRRGVATPEHRVPVDHLICDRHDLAARGPDSRAMWAELVSEPTAYRKGGDIVIIHRVHGRLSDGTPHEMAVADVYTVRDGRVVRMQASADPAGAMSSTSSPGTAL